MNSARVPGIRPRFAVFLIAAVAFLVRLLHVFSYESIPTNDMAAFVDLAVNNFTLANLFSPGGFLRYPPGYLIFLKPFFITLPAETAQRAVQIAQAALGAWTCVLLYRLGRRLHSIRAGLVAATIACFFPHYLFYTSFWMTENLFIPLYFAALLLWLRMTRKPGGIRFYRAGLVTAAVVLVRPAGLSLAPAALIAAWGSAADRRGRIRSLLLAAVGMLTLLLPWGVRNWIVTDHFYMVAPYAPFLLAMGNHPDSPGTTWDLPTPPGDFWEQLDHHRIGVVQFLGEDPWGALYLTTRLKWNAFWALAPPWPLSTLNPRLFWGEHFFPFLSWRMTMVLGLVGLLLARRSGLNGMAVACMACYVAFYMVFYGKPRYRLPVEGFFIAWAGITFAVVAASVPLLRQLRAQEWSFGISLLLILVLLWTAVDGALTRADLKNPEKVIARGDQIHVIKSEPYVALVSDDYIPLDRSRGRYLRLGMYIHRSGPPRITPTNGFIRISFLDEAGRFVRRIDEPRLYLEALPADRWIPVRLKAHIPPAAASCWVELIPDPKSPDTLFVDNPVLRYSRGNDLALEFLVPYLRKVE